MRSGHKNWKRWAAIVDGPALDTPKTYEEELAAHRKLLAEQAAREAEKARRYEEERS